MIRPTLVLTALAFLMSPALAADPVGIVSNVKVLSNRTEDVSSLEAWKRSFIKDGMTDRQKALAVWETVLKFRQQDAPPMEFLQNEGVHDPIKCFNVYGYGMCCCASANIEALARYAGLKARGWGITAHSVPEVFFDNDWHMLDASLLTYFPDANGKIASVKEISDQISGWLKDHPDYRGNGEKLYKFSLNNGWKKGPALLANCPFYDENGWLPAMTHGWSSTMQEYGRPDRHFVYEYGSAVGYKVNVQLRPGERLIRNWSNKGLHVNQFESKDNPGSLKGVPGKNDLRYSPKYGDLAPGRIGNGTLEYTVPLADGSWRTSALAVENVATKSEDPTGPAVHVKDPAQPASFTIRMPSSYVYLTGRIDLTAVAADGGEIGIAFSDNNGLDWKDIARFSTSGPQRIDLKPLVYRHYDYRLKFTLKGKGAGLDALRITHDIQHSQRALPALDKGSNNITFIAGPAEGTITIEGATNPDNKGKNILYTAFHPQITGVKELPPFLQQRNGQITFPIATPGEMTRIRVGCFYRARDARDGWDVQVSFDNGATFKTIGRAEGPFPGNSKYFVLEDVPKGTKSALVRFAGTQFNTTGIFDLRIDADYAEPSGGFTPVKLTYVWDENGAEKRDVHIATRPQETYQIRCEQKPLLKSLVLELAK